MKCILQPNPLRKYCGGVLFVFILLTVMLPATAQDTLTLKKPITPLPADTATVTPHLVRKATLLSTFLPGAGQVYNKKIWKVPIIYAGFGGMVYLIRFNNKNFKKFENALLKRYDNDPGTVDEYNGIYTEENLKTLSDFYRRNRDLSVIGLSVVYVLNIIDAHVDAQLFNFNVSDDLSLQWSPIIHPQPGMASTGLSLTLQF